MSIVCLVMIVKNESALIADTLTDLRPYIDYAVICDTGSTDNTPQVVQRICEEIDLPLALFYHEWKDFGYNRSLAFASVRSTDWKPDWYMVFDTDDRIVGDFPDSALKDISSETDALYCVYGSDNIQYQRLTFFRSTLEWGYRGVLHEFPCCLSKPNSAIQKEKLEGKYFIHINSRGISARSRDPDKFAHDAQILVRAIDDPLTDPDLLPRYIFYAARSFMDAGQYVDAIKYFDLYLEDHSRWYEERYDCRMNKARCMIRIVEFDPCTYSESDIRDAFLLASTEDPERAEPWYELARWYRMNRTDNRLAYAFAKLGCAWISNVPQRLLFLDQMVYKYRLLDELAVSAYWTGRTQECRELCTILLNQTGIPEEDRTRIQKNLAYCC